MVRVADVVRNGFVESTHDGSVVVLASDGATVFSVGTPKEPIFPRSVNKPLQLVGMMRAGLDVPDELLAIAVASHSGEEHHVALVREFLTSFDLDESALDNTPGYPLHEESARVLVCSGHQPDSVHQNCSGKHAAMLSTCVVAGWSTHDYRDENHPVQRAIRTTIEDLADERVGTVGVDGCGAPLFALSLVGLARAFRRLVTAPSGSPERRVADAMRAYPEVVGGTGRDVTALMRAVPGLLVKDGAEGNAAAALENGGAVALKIADGAARPRTPVLLAALTRLEPSLRAVVPAPPVLGHGEPVGEVRAAFPGGG